MRTLRLKETQEGRTKSGLNSRLINPQMTPFKQKEVYRNLQKHGAAL